VSVRVRVLPPDDFPKPRISSHPETAVALRGTNVTLSCVASSSSDSPMTTAWRKDGEVLYDGRVENYARYQRGELSYTTVLHLHAVNFTDEGRYQCVVTNHFGSNYSHRARLTVNGEPPLAALLASLWWAVVWSSVLLWCLCFSGVCAALWSVICAALVSVLLYGMCFSVVWCLCCSMVCASLVWCLCCSMVCAALWSGVCAALQSVLLWWSVLLSWSVVCAAPWSLLLYRRCSGGLCCSGSLCCAGGLCHI